MAGESRVITHAELVDEFGEDWISTLPREVAEQRVSDADARRVLSEVGLPKSLLEILTIGDFRRTPPPSLGEMLGGTAAERLPAHTLDYLVIATGMGGAVCLNGSDGRVYWYKAGDSQSFGLVSSSLEQFVEILHRLWHGLPDDLGLEYEDGGGEDDEVTAELRRLVSELRPLDPEGFDSPVMFWQHVTLFALRYLAAQ